QAAYRALDSVLPRLRDGRQARFLFLPDGEDPDTLIRDRGREEFEDRLRAATPLSEVFFARHQAEVDLNSLDGRARFVELCRPQLATIPDGAFRDMMYERMAELARSPAAGRAPPAAAATIREEAPAPRPPPGQRGRPTLVRQAIILLLNHPKLGGSAAPVEELVEDLRPGIPLLVELFQWCRDNPQAVTATVLGHWQGRRDHDVLGKLAQMQLPLDEDANVEAEFTGAVTRLVGEFRKLEIEAELAEFQSRISESGLSSLTAEEKDRYRKLLDLSENVTKRQ
ncbi:MAG: DNA primase, partial [Pseudomonadota bacterium]